MEYGSGAIFGCPAHDQRDLDFAIKYNIDFITVVKPHDAKDNFNVVDKAWTDNGVMINSGNWNGLKVSEAKKLAIQTLKN